MYRVLSEKMETLMGETFAIPSELLKYPMRCDAIKSKCGASVFGIKSIELLRNKCYFYCGKSISLWHNQIDDDIICLNISNDSKG